MDKPDKLNFYLVDQLYVDDLKRIEISKRGFTRVPDVNYGDNRKPKYLCGVVLNVNNVNYYVPVSSYPTQQPDNFLLKIDGGNVVGSLRFNYMFPVPKELTTIRDISHEPDQRYKTFLIKQLRYCQVNEDEIRRLAERTYKRVLMGKDPGLVHNSCDFALMERRCLARSAVLAASQQGLSVVADQPQPGNVQSMKSRMEEAKQKAKSQVPSHKPEVTKNKDREI